MSAMQPFRQVLVLAILVLAAGVLLPAAAFAASPPNDARIAPTAITVPAVVSGTTEESTLDDVDEPGSCAPLRGSVWYEFTPPAGRIGVRLRAGGDLDAVIDVFTRVRSQITPVDCEQTGADGEATVTLTAAANTRYLIRVGQRANSVPGPFTLEVVTLEAPPSPPGAALPERGVAGRLNTFGNAADAWSVRLRPATPYRINFASGEGACLSMALYGPDTASFDVQAPVRAADCAQYLVFTPGPEEGGRYTILVRAQPRLRGVQRYRLRVAPAGLDDLAPGRWLDNYRRVRGALNARSLDVVDLYRFDVVRPSELRLELQTRQRFAVTLLTRRGQSLATAGAGRIDRRLRPGRYFAAVRAQPQTRGRYVLRRILRTITSTRVSITGHRRGIAPPGRTLTLRTLVAPRITGPVILTVERFDPIEGWRFAQRIRTRAVVGRTDVSFLPPALGSWRVSAEFLGTRIAAPSVSGAASVLVASPLRPSTL